MKKNKEKSALKEVKGIKHPPRLNTAFIRQRKAQNKQWDAATYVRKIREGDKIFLSKAITLIESSRPEYFALGQQIVKKCLPYSGHSVRIGITGVPGVGKSTFIEALGKKYTSQGHKVAVLAIDPSSSLSKGSILGDKTRMEQLSRDPNAYIRPTASGNQLGGVARKTRETIILCEAAGFDKIMIETVGVGQSEVMAASMVDFFMLLKLAGAGDELQGIKRGIIEMADLIVINKAEADNLPAARLAQKAFQTALHYYPPKSNGWIPEVVLASALQEKGIDDIVGIIDKYVKQMQKNKTFEKKRQEQEIYWLQEVIKQSVLNRFYQQDFVMKNLEKLKQKIYNKEISVYEAAEILLNSPHI